MEKQKQGSAATAGGFFIFVGLIIGVVAGIYTGETSIGMIGGFGAGILAATILWIFDRARMNMEQ